LTPDRASIRKPPPAPVFTASTTVLFDVITGEP
jgi:hypothetical protein